MSDQTARQSVAALAHRLRLLHAEMKDLAPEARAALLREQIEAAMAGLAPGKAVPFLRELAEHFPDGSGPAAAPAAPAPREAGVPPPAVRPAAPAELFLAMAPEERAAAVRDLMAQGLVEVSPPARESALGAGPGAEAAAMLCGLVTQVVPFFLRTLSSLGVSSEGLVDQASLQRRLEALAQGEGSDADLQALRAEVHQLGVCLCALMSVIPNLGKFCTQALAQDLSAERIEDLARNEGKGAFERWEAIYWRKYREVSRAFGDGTLEREVNQRVATHVDKWLQRTRQRAPAAKGTGP